MIVIDNAQSWHVANHVIVTKSRLSSNLTRYGFDAVVIVKVGTEYREDVRYKLKIETLRGVNRSRTVHNHLLNGAAVMGASIHRAKSPIY